MANNPDVSIYTYTC